MISERFEEIKTDLKKEFAEELCEESLAYVEKASTPRELAGVLWTYMVVIACKPIPTVEWMRKWFSNDKEELNEYGMYLDQVGVVDNPQSNIVCFGLCNLTFNFSEPRVWNILSYGSSTLLLNTHTICNVNVRVKNGAAAVVGSKFNGSIIKIRRV